MTVDIPERSVNSPLGDGVPGLGHLETPKETFLGAVTSYNQGAAESGPWVYTLGGTGEVET
jgi:hypothetical protein